MPGYMRRLMKVRTNLIKGSWDRVSAMHERTVGGKSVPVGFRDLAGQGQLHSLLPILLISVAVLLPRSDPWSGLSVRALPSQSVVNVQSDGDFTGQGFSATGTAGDLGYRACPLRASSPA